MMMKASEFRETFFTPRSMPTDASIRNWIKQGDLRGKKLGGTFYVIVTDDDNGVTQQVKLEEEIKPNFSRYNTKGEK